MIKTILAILFFAGTAQAGVPFWQAPQASTTSAAGTAYLSGTLKVYPSTTTAAASPSIQLNGPVGFINATSSITAGAGFYGDGTTLTGVATSAQLTSTAAALSSEIARATAREDAIAVSTGVLQADLATEVSRAILRENAIAVSTGALEASKVNRAGDTMTGQLAINYSNVSISPIKLTNTDVGGGTWYFNENGGTGAFTLYGGTNAGNKLVATAAGSIDVPGPLFSVGISTFNINFGKVGVNRTPLSAPLEVQANLIGEAIRLAGKNAAPYPSYIEFYDPTGVNTHLGGIVQDSAHFGLLDTDWHENFTMLQNGNLGLGVSPIWNLEVAAAAGSRIAATDNGGASKKVLAMDSPTTANPYAQIFAYDYGGSVGLPLSVPYGNFGVGISGPAEKVEIYDGGLKMSGSAIANPFSVVTEGRGYYRHTYATAANGGSQVYSLTDGDQYAYGLTALIGVTDPTDTTPAIILQSGKSNGATSWAPLAAAETVFQIKNYTSELVTVLGGGSMGLGTISPDTSYKLDINGNSIMARATAANSSGYSIIFDESSGKFLEVLKRGSSATGNLGLPAGSAEILNYNNGAFGIYNANAGVDGYIALGTGGTAETNERVRITYDGKVGIGDPAPTAKLVVNGNIVSSGTVYAQSGFYGDGANLSGVSNLVASGLISVATGTINITGLDGNADGLYRLVFVSSVTSGSVNFSLYFNNDLTAGNYYSQSIRAVDTTVAASRDVNSVFAGTTMAGNGQVFADVAIYHGANGHIMYSATAEGGAADGSDMFSRDTKGHHVSVQANITSMHITCAADQMQIGTRWELYRSR